MTNLKEKSREWDIHTGLWILQNIPRNLESAGQYTCPRTIWEGPNLSLLADLEVLHYQVEWDPNYQEIKVKIEL